MTTDFKVICREGAGSIRIFGPAEEVSVVVLSPDGYDVEVNQDAFELGPNASKEIDVCVTPPPEAEDEAIIEVKFIADDISATQLLTLIIREIFILESNACIPVNNNLNLQYVPVEIINPGNANNFDVEVISSELNVRAVTPSLFNFKRGEARQVTLAISPKSMPARVAQAILILRDEQSKTKVLEAGVCFAAQFQEQGATVGLSSNFVKLIAGQSAVTFIKIRNTGNLPQVYTISALEDETEDSEVSPVDRNDYSGLKVTLAATQIELKAGEEKDVRVTLQASSNLANALYSIPIYVYSTNSPSELIATPTITASVQEAVTTTTIDLNPQVLEVRVDEDEKQIVVTLQVQNSENKERKITAGLVTLPQNWEAEVNPQEMQLQPGQIGEFEYTFTALELQKEDTSVTVKLTDELGREETKQIPIPLKSKELVSSPTGLFTLNEGSGGILIGVLFILALIGVFLFVKAYAARKELSLASN